MKENEKIFLAGGSIVLEKSDDEMWAMRRVDDENFIQTSFSAICTNCPKIVIPCDDEKSNIKTK